MKLNYYLLLSLFCLGTFQTQAQSVGVGSLFRPGVRLTANYLPTTSSDSPISLGSTQANLGLIIPLNGGASIDLKKLKVNAYQNFLLCNAGIRHLEGGDVLGNSNLYNFSLGMSGARFGIGSGLIAYSVNIGMIQPINSEQNPRLFGALGAMKVRIRGLNKQDFYGFGLVYAGNRFFPVPLLGIRRKLAKDLHATILLPAQADLTFSPKGGHKFSINAVWAGFNSNLDVPNRLTSDWRLQVTRFRMGAVANLKFSKQVRLLLDGGMNVYQRFKLSSDTALSLDVEATPSPSPYFRVSLRMNMGKSLVNSQMFGSDG